MRTKVWNLLFVLENNRIYLSIKKGLMITFLIFLLGSISRLIYTIPFTGVHNIIYMWQDGVIHASLEAVQYTTENYISLFLLITISYYYSITKLSNPILIIMSILTSIIDYLMAVNILARDEIDVFLGIPGILLAVCTAILSVKFFAGMVKVLTKRFPLSDMGSEDNLKVSFLSVIPMWITILKGAILCTIFNHVMENPNLYEVWIQSMIDMFETSGNELLNGIVYILSVNLSWFFGIHGGNALEPVLDQMLIPATTNPDMIISQGFLSTFVQMGGSGAVLCLMIALIIVCRGKSKATDKNMLWSCISVPFNISELVVFGIPLILNPIMLVPFIIVPLVSLVISYTATIIGFIPIVNESVLWAMPVGISGYYSTGSINGVIVQVLTVMIGTMIYIPFVKLYRKFLEEKEVRILELLIDEFRDCEKEGKVMPLLSRSDYSGQVATTVAKQLRADIEKRNIELFYQPQHNKEDVVIGAEALLRWKYQGKLLYPPFVIALAQEEQVAIPLALESLHIVIEGVQEISKTLDSELHISMNFSASQINDNICVQCIIEMIKTAGVEDLIYLELTEETSIQGLPNLQNNIEKLAQNGIAMAIDDFGMGQTSLSYLKENKFKYVKFDGALVKNLLEEPRSAEIITSIVNLGDSLKFEVIAEYVETKELKELLMELGCYIYQGYYYSPAISKDAFIEYCEERNQKKTYKI